MSDDERSRLPHWPALLIVILTNTYLGTNDSFMSVSAFRGGICERLIGQSSNNGYRQDSCALSDSS